MAQLNPRRIMRSLPTAGDVLRDIEFELVQGTITRGELGRALQAVKEYQGKLREETLQAGQVSEPIRRQWQVNDMLITLLQETAAALRATESRLRRVARALSVGSSAEMVAGVLTAKNAPDASPADDRAAEDGIDNGYFRHPLVEIDELEEAMHPGALQMELDVRPVRVPILGSLVRQVRIAFHNLVFFYVDRLVQKQTAVNQTYGDWLLRTVELCQDQQEQIDVLNALLAVLRDQLVEDGPSRPPSADS